MLIAKETLIIFTVITCNQQIDCRNKGIYLTFVTCLSWCYNCHLLEKFYYTCSLQIQVLGGRECRKMKNKQVDTWLPSSKNVPFCPELFDLKKSGVLPSSGIRGKSKSGR